MKRRQLRSSFFNSAASTGGYNVNRASLAETQPIGFCTHSRLVERSRQGNRSLCTRASQPLPSQRCHLRCPLARPSACSRPLFLRCQLAISPHGDRKSTRLNSSHVRISYAVFCLKKKKKKRQPPTHHNNNKKPTQT